MIEKFTLKELAEHYERTRSVVSDYVSASDYEAILLERNSLLQELHKANSTILDLQRIPPKFSDEYIAEIRAEAVEEFWFAGAGRMTTDEAKEYVAKVRQGGEK